MRCNWFRRGAVFAAALALVSCERPLAPPTMGPLNLLVVSGNEQSGSPEQELPNPLVVKVTRSNGSPVNNQILNFRVMSGGGSVFAGTAMTDARGIAQERWMLGSEGEQKVEVRAVDTETGEPLVFATFTATVVCRDCWTTLQSMRFPRGAAGVADANGKLYVIGGDTGTASSPRDVRFVEQYDPATDTWTEKARMPTERRALAAASINGIVYAVGGWTSGFVTLSTVEAYDPATDTWMAKAPMLNPRRFLSVVAHGGLLYALGGVDQSGETVGVVEVYNPTTNSWSEKSRMNFARYGMGIAVMGGTIYAVGGRGSTGEDSRTVSAYDIATDTWSFKAPLRFARGFLGAGAVNQVVYAMGGSVTMDEEGERPSPNEAYDPSTNTWTTKTPVPTWRLLLGVTAINGVIYTAGGFSATTSGVSGTLEAYRP